MCNRGVNNSCMAILSIDKCIGYEVLSSAYNTEKFINFIKTTLIPYFRSNRSKIRVMDNARFRHLSNVKELSRANNIMFEFIPPYSPQLNPILEFFSMLHSRYAT